MVYQIERLEVRHYSSKLRSLCLVTFLFASMFFCAALLTSQANAYSYSGSGQFNSNCVNNKTYVNSYGNSYGSTCRTDGNGAEINIDTPSVVEFNWLGLGWNGTVPANSIYSFSVSFRPVNGSFQNLNFGGGGEGLLNVDNLGGGTYLFTYYTDTAIGSVNIANGNIFGSINGDVRIYFSPVSYVTLANSVSSSDISALGSYLADISSNTYLSAVREQYIFNILNDNISANVAIAGQRLQYILDELQTNTTAVNNVRGAIEQANDDANDRYQDEKDTITGNVSDGSDTIDNLDLSLTPVNPISWFFSGLEVHSCYDITDLAVFINYPNRIYCSWFSDNIRNIVSPVINLFATITILGFVYSWLKKGGV